MDVETEPGATLAKMGTLTRRQALLQLGSGMLALLASSSQAQENFGTEVRLGVDRARVAADRLRAADERRLKEILTKRLPLLTDQGGKVEIASPDDIRIRVPVPKVDEVQIRALIRRGLLEVRHLDDLRTTFNPDGRYLMNILAVQDAREERSDIRFLDSKTNRRIPTHEFLKKCPLILENEDLFPDSAEVIGGEAASAVRVHFTESGTRRLEKFMRKPGRMLAIVVDGELMAINAVVRKVRRAKKDQAGDEVGEMDIGGNFANAAEASYLAAVFNSGPLPVPLKLLSRRGIVE